jgi:hypothetical protein
MGSLGGAVVQPILGRVADVWSYATSFLVSAGVSALALPFAVLARREDAKAGPARKADEEPAVREPRI